MPQLRCSHPAAYVDLGEANPADGASGAVMIVGRGEPVLSRAKHGARIARCVAKFSELKERSGR
jgi:hypothetical protein